VDPPRSLQSAARLAEGWLRVEPTNATERYRKTVSLAAFLARVRWEATQPALIDSAAGPLQWDVKRIADVVRWTKAWLA